MSDTSTKITNIPQAESVSGTDDVYVKIGNTFRCVPISVLETLFETAGFLKVGVDGILQSSIAKSRAAISEDPENPGTFVSSKTYTQILAEIEGGFEITPILIPATGEEYNGVVLSIEDGAASFAFLDIRSANDPRFLVVTVTDENCYLGVDVVALPAGHRGLVVPVPEAVDSGKVLKAGSSGGAEWQPESGGGLTSDVKAALLACFRGVKWIDEQSAARYDALEAALYPPADLVSISASFDTGGAPIYDTATLDSLRQYLTVTALYDDQTTETISTYTLSGTLAIGTNTITVTYGGKTTTITVTVTATPLIPTEYQRVEYIASANTGSGPYLIIPFTFPANFTIRGKTRIASKPSSNSAPIIGAKYTASNNTYTSRLEIGYGTTEGRMYAWSGASASVIVSGLYSNPVEFEAVYSSTSPYRTLTVSTPSDEATGTSTTTANNDDMTHVLVFALTYAPFAGRVDQITIEDTNGDALLDLIPCYRKSDGEIGMFERVSGTFYINVGSTDTFFTKGSDVED